MFQVWSHSVEMWCSDPGVRGMFLPDDVWQSVLQQGFNVVSRRLEIGGQPFGTATGFHAGPFCIGYLDFPSGLPIASLTSLPSPRTIRDAVSDAGLDVLRFQLPFSDPRFT